jgi:hypothetical protein
MSKFDRYCYELIEIQYRDQDRISHPMRERDMRFL